MFVGAIVALMGLVTVLRGQQAAPAAAQFSHLARTPKDAAEFEVMFQQIKDWGRWGNNDQLGAANQITPAKRKEAAGLIKAGRHRLALT